MVKEHYVHDLSPEGQPTKLNVYLAPQIASAIGPMLKDSKLVTVTENPAEAHCHVVRSVKNNERYNEEKLGQLPALQLLVRAGVETSDVVDLQQAMTHGVSILNTPGPSTPAVARHTLGLLTDMRQHTTYNTVQAVFNRNWGRTDEMAKPVEEAVPMGIVGMGRIGTEVGRMALKQGIASKLYFYDPPIDFPEGVQAEKADTLYELFYQAKIISVHASGTQPLITPEMVADMKNVEMLANCGRGELIPPATIVEYLKKNPRAMYAADVMEGEGNPSAMFADPAIQQILNIGREGRVIITPHIAASGKQTAKGNAEAAKDSVLNYAEHGLTHRGALGGTPPLDERWTDGAGWRVMIGHRNQDGTIEDLGKMARMAKIGIGKTNDSTLPPSKPLRDFGLAHLDIYQGGKNSEQNVLAMANAIRGQMKDKIHFMRVMRFE